MKIIQGDLLTLAESGYFDAIVQGCNCFCTMGSGIAAQIKQRYPTAYAADCTTVSGDIGKLGSYTVAPNAITGSTFVIFNAYTQFDFNRNGSKRDVFEYASFELILRKLSTKFPGIRWGFPEIGMGLAGGDRNVIYGMLEQFSTTVSSQGGTVTIVQYKP